MRSLDDKGAIIRSKAVDAVQLAEHGECLPRDSGVASLTGHGDTCLFI